MAVYLTDDTISSIGEASFVLRATGDDHTVTTVYAATRTSGPYSDSSGSRSDIKNGVGATWFENNSNAYRVSFATYGHPPGTTVYYGIYADDGGGGGGVLYGSVVTKTRQAPADTGRPLPRT